jgi:hypothetical protein
MTGAIFPGSRITPGDLNNIRAEAAEYLAQAGQPMEARGQISPQVSDPKPLSELPQYKLMQELLAAVEKNENNELTLDLDLLEGFGDFKGLANLTAGIVDLANDALTIRNPQIQLVIDEPGIVGTPPEIEKTLDIKTPDIPMVPEKVTLKVTGDVTFMDTPEVHIIADFFYREGERDCSLKFTFTDKDKTLGVKDVFPAIIVCTFDGMSDPTLGFEINEGVNFFGTFLVTKEEEDDNLLSFLSQMLGEKALPVHASVEKVSKKQGKFVFEEFVLEAKLEHDTSLGDLFTVDVPLLPEITFAATRDDPTEIVCTFNKPAAAQIGAEVDFCGTIKIDKNQINPLSLLSWTLSIFSKRDGQE